jgi:hypothetical protein
MVSPLAPREVTLVFPDQLGITVALGRRTGCLSICGNQAGMHSTVSGLMYLEVLGFFFF